jgi:hypothetical protein
MAIKELDSGQRHTFAPSALRVQLTGAMYGGAVLRALDQAGNESITVRLSDAEVVLTPQPRRLRLVATPTHGGSFPAGTSIGVTLRTEGASTATEQILVSEADAGALSAFEIAVLEFAADRAVLTVSNTGLLLPSTSPSPELEFTSGSVFGTPQAATLTPQRLTAAEDDHPSWLQPGRYALRDAAKLGMSDVPVTAWSVVLDGSGSMHPLHDNGQLDVLVGVVCGTYVHWTKQWASASVIAGVRVTEVITAAQGPQELTKAAFADKEPNSWSTLGEAARQVVNHMGPHGAVLIVTDGVPGDIERLCELAEANPASRFTIVTTGMSRYALSSDAQQNWWQEELGGMAPIDALPNISAVAVRVTPEGLLDLSGSHAAELALRLTAPLGERSSP